MAKLYVGNLPFEATEDELRSFFSEVTELSNVTVVRDKFTNRSRGFAFVEIDDAGAANKAVSVLNGRALSGRPLKIAEAQPQGERRPGGGGGGQRGGGGGRRRF